MTSFGMLPAGRVGTAVSTTLALGGARFIDHIARSGYCRTEAGSTEIASGLALGNHAVRNTCDNARPGNASLELVATLRSDLDEEIVADISKASVPVADGIPAATCQTKGSLAEGR